MSSPNLMRLFCPVVVFAAFFFSTASAQQPPPEVAAPPAEEEGQGSAEAQQSAEEQQEEPGEQAEVSEPPVPEGIELVEGSGYRYDVRGRRDPFVSLALGINIEGPGVRPPGLSGMLIQEVALHGIVKTVDGYIAMIQGTDNKAYFARVGQLLYDGTIETIDDGAVIFRQEINDPLRIEKFHRIEKTLHPVEEGR